MKNLFAFLISATILFSVSSCKKNHQKPSCFNTTQLEKRWNNAYTISQYYNSTNNITNTQIDSPKGYFTLNTNGSYNVLSNNIPLDGIWQINEANCNLVLDINTSIQRSFSVIKLTNDSLVISTKDSANMVIRTQHYVKN